MIEPCPDVLAQDVAILPRDRVNPVHVRFGQGCLDFSNGTRLPISNILIAAWIGGHPVSEECDQGGKDHLFGGPDPCAAHEILKLPVFGEELYKVTRGISRKYRGRPKRPMHKLLLATRETA